MPFFFPLQKIFFFPNPQAQHHKAFYLHDPVGEISRLVMPEANIKTRKPKHRSGMRAPSTQSLLLHQPRETNSLIKMFCRGQAVGVRERERDPQVGAASRAEPIPTARRAGQAWGGHQGPGSPAQPMVLRHVHEGAGTGPGPGWGPGRPGKPGEGERLRPGQTMGPMGRHSHGGCFTGAAAVAISVPSSFAGEYAYEQLMSSWSPSCPNNTKATY